MTPRSRAALKVVAALGLAGLAWAALREVSLPSLALRLVEWSRSAGPGGAALYAVGYVLSAVLLLPASVLTLGAGYAWGPVWGVALVSPVSVLAATAAFVLGRTVLRSRVEQRIGGDARVQAIDRAIGENGLKLVVLLRLSPVLPFNLLNYALALTRVRLRDYVLGSALGMFPATVVFVYLGSLVTSGAEFLSGQRPAAGTAGTALAWAGLVATLLAVVLLTRASKRALAGVLQDEAR